MFERILFGPFREAKPAANDLDGPWFILLPEDRPNAAHILFMASHRGIDNILPGQVKDVRQIYNILVFANKYNMTGCIEYEAEYWLGLQQGLRKGTLPWDVKDLGVVVGIAAALGIKCFLRPLHADSVCTWVWIETSSTLSLVHSPTAPT